MKKSKVSILLAVVMLLSMFLPQMVFGAEQLPPYKVSGYLSPDFISTNTASELKAGFRVDLVEAGLFSITNTDGYFEMPNVPQSQSYTLRISKTNYLTREAKFDLDGDKQIGTKDSPFEIWIGDLPIGGKQDSCINILDIMELAKSFSSVEGQERYNPGYDFNNDTAINFDELFMVAKHFNTATSTYLPLAVKNYLDPSMPVDERVKNLLSQMTLEEKIGQMVQSERATSNATDVRSYYLGSVLSGGGSAPLNNTSEGWMNMVKEYQNGALSTRLGIPILYGTDAVHGHNNAYGSVILPQNIGLGAANDPDLMSEVGKVTAEEMLSTGVTWNFSPCIAVARDERWGRTYESYGESTDLVSKLSVPLYKTLQEQYGITTTAKHFLADGGTTNGVDQGDAKISEEELRRVHLPVYKSAVDAGVKTVMISFSSWNGVKMHENKYLITDVLKGELGFKGFVVSDWEAIHKVSGDSFYQQVVNSVNAGVDMLMEPDHWKDCFNILRAAVAYRDIPMSRINDAVSRILKVKFEMGLFEKPLGDQSLVTSAFGSDEHREIAKKAARESLVLLKNENNILPLRKNAKIFVTGPAADDVGVQCGGWTKTWRGGTDGSEKWVPGTTILEGFQKIAAQNGGEIITDPARARDADVAVVVVGETPYAEVYGQDDNNLALSGGMVALKGNDTALAQAEAVGLPIVTIMVSGRPRIITNELKDWSAFVEAWLPGSEGDAIPEVLYGDYNFTGKLPCSWPASYDQIPVNYDDLGNKVPLFPFGYGLTMTLTSSEPSSTASVSPTPTATPTPKPTALEVLTESTTTVGDWSLYSISNTEVSAKASDMGVTAEVYKTGTSEDDIQLVQIKPNELAGGKYDLKLSVNSSTERKIRVALEKADQTMETVVDQEVALKSGENSITVPFSVNNKVNAALSVRLGYFNADGSLEAHKVTVGTAELVRTGDVATPTAPVPTEDPNRFKNKVTNGDFSDGKNGWWGIENVDGVGVVDVTGGSDASWKVMCGNYLAYQLQKGRTYKVSFDLASELEQNISCQIVNADNKDSEITLKTFNVPGDATMYTYSFDDLEVPEDCTAKIAFQLGGYGTADSTYKISIDNVDVHEVPKIVDVAVNGDFSEGKGWCWANKAAFDVVDGVCEITAQGGFANPWDVMFGNSAPFQLEKGRTYSVSFDVSSEIEQDIKFQVVDADDKELTLKNVHVPADGEMHTFTFDDLEVPETCSGKWALQLGGYGTTGETYKINIDNVRITYPDISASVTTEDPNANMIRNSDFAAGLKYWGLYTALDGAGTFAAANGEGVLSITNTGTEDYSIQFYQDGIKLYKGNKYKLSFKYKSDVDRTAEVRIQQNGGTYAGYLDDKGLEFTNDWQTYEKEFTMTYDSDTSARLCFNLGKAGDATEVNQNIYFDDFSLVMTEGMIPGPPKANPIRLNQVGYRTNDVKVGFIISADRTFKIFTADNKLVMTGNTPVSTVDADGQPVADTMSDDIVRTADFTSLNYDGNYYMKVRADKSPAFAVKQTVYDDLTAAVLKMFYYQHCGGDGLDAQYVGDTFAHDPCHTGKAKYFDSTDPVYGSVEVDVSGGWHDAGDYGRYVTPASKAVADLLMTAENFPAMADMDFGGPNKLLAEARYEIEWMLKMQNPDNGAVYHKVTTQNHASMTVLPDDDLNQLYLSGVSAQAAGDFAAVMAYAYRMYKSTDSVFADRCLAAAEKAWAWLEANPDVNGYTDSTFFGTGTYNDGNSMDERFWAAAELYKTTKDDKYLTYIKGHTLPKAGFGWADMGSYALVAYLTTDGVDKNDDLYKSISSRFITDADKIVDTWKKDGYKVALDDYVWGSNKDLCDRAMIMIIANKLSPNPDYDAAIMDQLDYLLGRNANDISYVTGFGEKSAKHPHHRQSIIAEQAVPGMLVGGPNGDIMTVIGDPVATMVDENTPQAKCYADVDGSYATNEICIYWNSPLVYILGYIYKK